MLSLEDVVQTAFTQTSTKRSVEYIPCTPRDEISRPGKQSPHLSQRPRVCTLWREGSSSE